MKPIVFSRISDMDFYRGITESDYPVNGGSYVKETGDAHEAWNFDPIQEQGESFEKCIGYAQPTGNSNRPQIHLEKIVGCQALKKSAFVTGVTVVFVSRSRTMGLMRVVGFYKNATVYRYIQELGFQDGYIQCFQFEARKEDCTLLPRSERDAHIYWDVPSSTKKPNTFGMGRSNIWFAASGDASEAEIKYTEHMLQRIDEYSGRNLMEETI